MNLLLPLGGALVAGLLLLGGKKKAHASESSSSEDGYTGVSTPEWASRKTAAIELTEYLKSIGGLAGRTKEDKARIAAWSAALGVSDPRGLYGRDMATAVMSQPGDLIVPVSPFYWPKTNWQSAKTEFVKTVQAKMAEHPDKTSELTALIADVWRS